MCVLPEILTQTRLYFGDIDGQMAVVSWNIFFS